MSELLFVGIFEKVVCQFDLILGTDKCYLIVLVVVVQ